jgi:transcriptional regulator with XRE-family HTH domain
MKQTVAVVDALKRALRARGVTYAEVAKALRLSEASVKRLFSSGHFTLERFEQVCELARTSLSELAKSMDSGSEDISQLTLEQEREIMGDRKLLLVALCALNHLSLEQITHAYDVSKPECIRLLVTLDRIKLLELLPNNRIKLRVTRAFSWRPNGPIQQYFKARAQNEFFGSRFDQPGELMLLVNGMLSKASTEAIIAKLRRIANEVAELHHADAHRPLGERRASSLLVALRPWELDEFRELRRKQPPRKG